MVAPLIWGVGALGAYLAANQAYQSRQVSKYTMDYQRKYNADVQRFYHDYEKRTGVKVKYPYKSGSIPNETAQRNAEYSYNNAYNPAIVKGTRSLAQLY